MSAPCHLLKPTAGPPASWSASSGFTECVRSENGDGQDFAAARLAAYKHCAVVLQEQVASALGGLNEQRLGEIGEFLNPSTPVLIIGALNRPWLRAYINETDLGRVNLERRKEPWTNEEMRIWLFFCQRKNGHESFGV